MTTNWWTTIAAKPRGPGFWLPAQSSTIADKVDFVWDVTLWVSVFFFVLITVLMGVFVWKYRGRRGQGTTATHDHNTPLELTWTIIPTLIVVVIFWLGFETYLNMATPPQNAMTIQVTGQKWKWLFTYPNGWVDESLHVPADTDVALVMTSEDVIHSFYVPSFRVKKDVVPGRYSRLWFNAREPGEYQAFCTEYCGTDHSAMLAKVVVHEPGGYEKWLADASNLFDKYTLPQIGEIYYTKYGCKSCHSLDGTRVIGPSFQGIWGSEHALADGSRVVVDENYIRESILEPQAKVVAGYDPVMPTFKGRFKDEDVTAMIEYIKTLK